MAYNDSRRTRPTAAHQPSNSLFSLGDPTVPMRKLPRREPEGRTPILKSLPDHVLQGPKHRADARLRKFSWQE